MSVITRICDSLENGNFSQAMDQTVEDCESAPLVMAERVGMVVRALIQGRRRFDLVETYLDRISREIEKSS